MSNSNGSSMLRAAPLWAKTSVRGGHYLTGRLGGVKVLVMENRDRQSDNDPLQRDEMDGLRIKPSSAT